MKKILYFLFVAFFAIALSSCEKEDSDDAKFSVKGKVYAGKTIEPNTLFPTGIYTVFRFLTETDVEITSRKGSPTGAISGDPKNSTYTFNYPNISIVEPMSSGDDIVYEGTFVDETCFRVKTRFGYWEFTVQ